MNDINDEKSIIGGLILISGIATSGIIYGGLQLSHLLFYFL